MKKNKQRRWLLALIIIAVVIIASVGIALSYRDNPGSIPMSAVNDDSGGALIAWHNNGGIYSQRVDSSGQEQWQKGGVLIARTLGIQHILQPSELQAQMYFSHHLYLFLWLVSCNIQV